MTEHRAPETDGGDAFPNAGFDTDSAFWSPSTGMSLRDYFAAAALTGMAASFRSVDATAADIAFDAYVLADAMLRKRGRAK